MKGTPFTNFRKWKVKKRSEVKAVIEALEKLEENKFYTPDCGEIFKAKELMAKLRSNMKDSNWG